MAEFDAALEAFDDELGALEASMAGTQAVSASFKGELEGMRSAMASASADTRNLTRSFSSDLKGAFGDLAIDGSRLSDVLRGLAANMADSAFRSAVTPVTDALGGLLAGGVQALAGGAMAFAKGGVLSSGRVAAFAKGGIIEGPTHFPMRGGATGLMGEAGPEAIMPLARGADGRLGVRAQAGRPVQVTMHISTPDVAGFQRSRAQIAAGVQRAIRQGSRNL